MTRMTSRMTKGGAFRWGMLALFGVVSLVAWRDPAALGPTAEGAFLGIVGLVASFGGANVADNWQRSKYYHPEMEGK